jgi:hypothetical protein
VRLSDVIDIPFAIEDLDKVFEISDFLENRDELIALFKPEVSKYFVRDEFFKPPFRKAYLDIFDDIIVSLIKKQIIAHYPTWTAEEIMILCDKDFLKLITQGTLFDPNNYKEGDDDGKH